MKPRNKNINPLFAKARQSHHCNAANHTGGVVFHDISLVESVHKIKNARVGAASVESSPQVGTLTPLKPQVGTLTPLKPQVGTLTPLKTTSKYTEFPNIQWGNFNSEITQKAILLYDERVVCYHKMQELYSDLADNPDLADEICRLDKRNRECDEELKRLNEVEGVKSKVKSK